MDSSFFFFFLSTQHVTFYSRTPRGAYTSIVRGVRLVFSIKILSLTSQVVAPCLERTIFLYFKTMAAHIPKNPFIQLFLYPISGLNDKYSLKVYCKTLK